MRGTTNTLNSYVSGNTVPANQINDLTTLLVRADDDAFYEQNKLEAPPGAGPIVVTVGFSPLRDGPFVVGTGARAVLVHPMRVARSSTSTTTPRELISGVISSDTNNASIAAAPGAGLWGYELLYAQLAYVDASNPSKGTTVTLQWAPSPAYVAFAVAPNFAVIPAHTASPPTWNIPLAYVRNYNGQASIAQEDIVEVAPGLDAALASGYTPVRDTELRIGASHSGIDTRRGYSSANNDPTKLVLGGASRWVSLAQEGVLTKTVTPIVVGRRNVEVVDREFTIPRCKAASGNGTAGTGGVAVFDLELDNSRDWRGANFRVEMWLSTINAEAYGEDDASVADPRAIPSMGAWGMAYFLGVGNSWVATNPHAIFGARLWASVFGRDADLQGIGVRNGLGVFFAATEGWGIFVDPTNGKLMWYANRVGAGDGPPIWILLHAVFGNHLP